MKSWGVLFSIFFLLIGVQTQARQLAHLRMIGKPQETSVEFVGSNHRNVKGRIYAMAISVRNGTDIYLKGIKQGQADKELWFYPGKYQLKIQLNGSMPKEQTITVTKNQYNTFAFSQLKNASVFNLVLQPSYATLLINKTDYGSRCQVKLAPDIYKVEVLDKGYYPQSATITEQRGQLVSRVYCLVQRVGKLRFSILPVFADVLLKRNGRIIQRWRGLKLIKDLPIGQYEIIASANGYSTVYKTINILENQTTTVDLRLEKGLFLTGEHYNTKITGELRLSISPSDAQFTIDGTPITDNYLILPVGKYHINCQKSGFVGQNKTVQINQNVETRIEIQLAKKSINSAITRSVLFPGWGQSYKESAARGWLYGLSFLASAAGAYYFTDQYNKMVKDYNDIRSQYENAVDYQKVLTLGDQMESKYKKVQDNEKMRNYFYIATAGIWLLNVLDAALMPPGWQRSEKYALDFKENAVQLQVSLR